MTARYIFWFLLTFKSELEISKSLVSCWSGDVLYQKLIHYFKRQTDQYTSRISYFIDAICTAECTLHNCLQLRHRLHSWRTERGLRNWKRRALGHCFIIASVGSLELALLLKRLAFRFWMIIPCICDTNFWSDHSRDWTSCASQAHKPRNAFTPCLALSLEIPLPELRDCFAVHNIK